MRHLQQQMRREERRLEGLEVEEPPACVCSGWGIQGWGCWGRGGGHWRSQVTPDRKLLGQPVTGDSPSPAAHRISFYKGNL